MRWIGLVVVVMASSCQPHMKFASPSPSLTPSERVDEYNRLVGTKEHWIARNGSVMQHSIILQNGWEVFFPEDLLPLVAPDSTTAIHARNAARARASADHWSVAGFAMFVVGAAIGLVTYDSSPIVSRTGFVAAVGGVVMWIAVGNGYKAKAVSETHIAYEAFDDDLAARLNVCAAGLQIVPCETMPPPPAPPTAPPAPAPNANLPPGKVASRASAR